LSNDGIECLAHLPAQLSETLLRSGNGEPKEVKDRVRKVLSRGRDRVCAYLVQGN
jgi:hypothetical protein